MTARLATAAALIALVTVSGACSDTPDADGDETTTTVAIVVSTTPEQFTGDPDSPFCRRLAEADERPVRDPFEAGIDPGEVQVRMRATLRVRFDEIADLAPAVLDEDLDDLVVALAALDEALADAGYDFAVLADDTDLAPFDAPEFAATADRLAAYRADVCG